MSHNQSRFDRSETAQYRRTGQKSSYGQQRGSSGQSGWVKGRGSGVGATGLQPTNSLPSNQSFKKSNNNAHGVQARTVGSGLNSKSSHADALAPRSTHDGSYSGQPLQGAPNALSASASVRPTDSSVKKATRSDLKTPSSDANAAVLSSAKIAPIDTAKGDEFPLQFGSFKTHIPIFARTSSAPPNLDEQKVDQARHMPYGAAVLPSSYIPKQHLQRKEAVSADQSYVPKQHLQMKEAVSADQSNCGEAHPQANAKKEIHVSCIPTACQSSECSVHSISMPQPISKQFAGPSPHIHPPSIPFPGVSDPQVKQQMISAGLPHYSRPAAQVIISQGQNLGFNHQTVPPSGNPVINMSSQFPQHGGGRGKSVKITNPNTKEELRLDKPAGTYLDNISSGLRSHSNLPQSQSSLSFPSHGSPVDYYPNPCNQSLLYPTSSLPLTSSHFTHRSQAPNFNYPVSQAFQTAPRVKCSTVSAFPVSTSGNPIYAISESLNIVPVVASSVSSPTAPVTIKPVTASVGELIASISQPTVEKNNLHKHSITYGKDGLSNVQRVPDNSESSRQQLKPIQTFPVSISMETSPSKTISYAPPMESPVITQTLQTITHVDSSTDSSLPGNKLQNPMHAISELLNIAPVVASPSMHVTTEPEATIVGEKVASVSQPIVEKNDLGRLCKVNGEDGLTNLLGDHENSENSQQHLKPYQEHFAPKSFSVPCKQTAPVAVSVDSIVSKMTSSAPSAPSRESPMVLINVEAIKNESLSFPNSNVGPQIEPSVKALFQAQQVPGLPASTSSLLSTTLGGGISVNEVSESTETEIKLSLIEANIVSFESSEPVIDNDVVTESRTERAGIDSKFSLEPSDETGAVDHYNRQDGFSHDGHLKYAAVGASELKDVMLPEGIKDGGGGDGLSSDSISMICLDPTSKHVVRDSVLNGPSDGIEVFSLETMERKVKKPAGFDKDDSLNPNLVVSTAIETFPTPHSEILQSNILILTESDINGKSPDASLSRSNTLPGVADSVVKPIIPDPDLDSVLLSSSSDKTLKHGVGSAKKPGPELGRSKSLVVKGKKKMREILQKADAAGTTSDLYNAYKGPKDKRETDISLDSIEVSSSFRQDVTGEVSIAIEEGKDSKMEPDDWEDAADISTPKLESSDCREQVHAVNNHSDDGVGSVDKKYTRDFLLTLSNSCISLPRNFDVKHDLRALILSNSCHSDNEPLSNGERINDRQLDRRGNGMMDDDKWKKFQIPSSGRDARMENGSGSNNVLGFRPGQGITYTGRNSRDIRGGFLPGPPTGMQRYGSDVDRWSHGSQKGLIPSPQPPSVVMHKAEKKYEVGKVTDEEQAKQRQLKAVLNKLTPQNFEKLFEQVKAVNIDKAVTLTGTISQIFDKALMEPTFCEMYANFCSRLAAELPVLEEGDDKITFKRLLLNKCQEEFERGEREQEEADRVDDGEIKLTEAEREDKRLKARRRMLGNIRLIGELYKKRMLTERIMHECIKKLLCQFEIPEEEDIEALCKLMSTIGEMIDHTKAKEHIDFYFERMTTLSNNMKLSSRVRFMLKDSIDLRMNKWQERRKIDGPKKIEEVHRDAVQERQAQVSRMTRNPPIIPSRKPMEFTPRGSNSNILSSPNPQISGYRGLPIHVRGGFPTHGHGFHAYDHGFGTQDLRPLSSVLQRPILGPQGGLAKEMSSRAQSSISSTRDDVVSRYMPERIAQGGLNNHDRNNRVKRNQDYSENGSVSSLQPSQPENVWSEDRMRFMSIEAIKEFYSAKEKNEICLCIKDLNYPGFHPTMIYLWVRDSFERKDAERQLLARLLVYLISFGDGILTQSQLIRGFKEVLISLEDAMHDAPKAAQFLGQIFGKLIMENVIPLKEIERLICDHGKRFADDLLKATMEIFQC